MAQRWSMPSKSLRCRFLALQPAVVWAFLALWAAPAHAGGEIRATAAFSVAKDPSGQKAATTVEAALRAQVARTAGLRLIEPARVLSGDPRTREEETLERARAALADGRRAYDALSLDDAIARLGQAVSLYQQTGALLGDLEELVSALAYLGAALVLRGSADEGESTFVELLTVRPDYQLDGFPPPVTKVFERAVGRLDNTPAGGVEIYSTPPYAAVYLDGRFEGVTPLTLDDLVSGTHYLRLEKLGYTIHGAPLEIAPKQRITSQTRLNNVKRGAELRDLAVRATPEVEQEAMGGQLRQLARLVVADTLIFVSVSQSGNDATFAGGVYDAVTGTRLALERAVTRVGAPTFATDIDAYVQRLITAAVGGAPAANNPDNSGGDGPAFGLGGTKSSPNNPPPPLPTTGIPGSVARQEPPTPSEVYLGWTMIGIGTAALITGTVFGILAKGVHDDFRVTSQVSPDLEDIKSRGQTNGYIADGMFIGGGLAVAGGITILLISKLSTPSAGELIGVVPLENGALVTFGGDF